MDRIDQADLPLNYSYQYSRTGRDVTAYIVDTGIQFTHAEFGGRATRARTSSMASRPMTATATARTSAGTLGGARHGVARQVKLVAVRVLDCYGTGYTSEVVAGIDWVTAHHTGTEPAVANMSLGTSGTSPAKAVLKATASDDARNRTTRKLTVRVRR